MAAFRGVLCFSAADTGGLKAATAVTSGIRPPVEPRRIEASRGRTAELVALVEACRDVGGLAGRRLSPAGILASLQDSAGRTVTVWTAETLPQHDAAAPLGLISLVTTSGPRGISRHTIGWLLVHPAARRRGVGRMLAAAAIDAARAAAAREVWIEVHPGWTGAWAFWQSIGFRPR